MQLQVTRRWYDRTIKSLPSTFMFWPWREVEIHAKVDIELSEEFNLGSKLAPILFSHGFCGNRCMYSVQCSELASFGYLVFAIDHLDGSGNLTETRQQTIVKFNTSMPRDQMRPGEIGQREVYKMTDLRKKENIELIDEILQDGFLQSKLKFPAGARLNKEKIIMAGHSFGAASSLLTGHDDPRVKAVIVTDNWQYPFQTKIEQNYFDNASVPVCWNFSISYPTLSEEVDFDQQGYFLRTLDQFKTGHKKHHGCSKIDYIVMKNTHHDHQSDAICVFPLEIDGYSIPSEHRSHLIPRSARQLADLHQSIAWSWLSFLGRAGLKSCSRFDQKEIEELLDRVRETNYKYMEKYEPKRK